MGNEPKATFSTCFGAPFMALPPSVYSSLLREKIAKHKVSCWLVNHRLSGGGFGVGKRISLPHTRSIFMRCCRVNWNKAPMAVDPVFGISVPQSCPNVPRRFSSAQHLGGTRPAFDKQAQALAVMFHKNFAPPKYTDEFPEEIKVAGPTFKANYQSIRMGRERSRPFCFGPLGVLSCS